MIEIVGERFEVHFTIPEESFDRTKYGETAVNHGYLLHRDYVKLIQEMAIVVGLGFPYNDFTGK